MKPKNLESQASVKSETIGDLVSIFKRGSNWHANFQSNGKQQRTSLKTSSKKEARRRALLLEASLLKGEYQSADKRTELAAAVVDYLNHLKTERRAKKTISKCELTLKRLEKLAFAHHVRTLQQVDLKLIDAYRAGRVAAKAKPKTVHNETVIIRQLINFALARNMIKADPLKGLKLKSPKPTRQPCWSRAEVEKILAAAAGFHQSALILLAETGARVGEIKFLTWDDIDYANSLIHIRPKDDWQPKTGDQRAVPMSPLARAALENLPRHGRWVVTTKASARYPKPDRQISERRLLLYLKRVLKRFGLQGHLHTFRHSFISNALMAGIPEAIVRQWVGHVDREVMKLYTHIADEASQAAMQRLAQANLKPPAGEGA
jgi:integrase